MDILGIIETLGTVLLGGGMFAFVEFLITRHDKKNDKQEEILESIGKISDKVSKLEEAMEQRDAVSARTEILRFDDELCNGIRHSKEYFMQQLHNIDVYESYCSNNHTNFKNSFAVEAIAHIRDTYRECRDENKFI